ncbi:SCO6745 family protein [Wenjunlia tyrosinilytica]|jgi:hypothetical protein|uniref:SalK n=1 Tax=Wenjunlia tyrosinilytica TaxID=1544741 RepID=A0A917ZUS9_9ACTN|nr:hypothetical protein [Wenjunlia tyrosinilytica]GGO94129.1 hypothetical protein GCM10012280_48250 [Wenjunlia tyrosinilytica]
MADEPGPTRRMWWMLEPVHAVLYYAPEVFEEAAALGYAVDTRWPSYFAWRSAPLGVPSAELVASSFYSFSPRMVEEHVRGAWAVAAPQRVLEARTHAMDRALRAVLGELIGSPELAEAAASARRAAEAAMTAGRPLGAANAGLSWPQESHLVLWQAATVLREHRGDGHVAALLTAGLDPLESLVSFAAVGAASTEVFGSRGWSDQEWKEARERLASRGWLDAEGRATEAGLEGRAAIERLTDELAAGPWRELGQRDTGRLAQLLGPVVHAVLASGLLPGESTLGIGRAPTPTAV